jgi:hypothetical protein
MSTKDAESSERETIKRTCQEYFSGKRRRRGGEMVVYGDYPGRRVWGSCRRHRRHHHCHHHRRRRHRHYSSLHLITHPLVRLFIRDGRELVLLVRLLLALLLLLALGLFSLRVGLFLRCRAFLARRLLAR